MKGKAKPVSKSSRNTNPETETTGAGVASESTNDSTKEIMKDFLVSVMKLISGIKKDKEDKAKKKKKDNSDLLKNLADLLN